MFYFKLIATKIILISSFLSQQSAIAYPKTSSNSELNYLKASLQNLYGNITPEMTDYLQEMYNNQDPSTEIMLSGGYQVCDGIKLANAQGIDSQTLIEQEISTISQVTNSILKEQGISLTEEQIINAYNPPSARQNVILKVSG